MRWIAAAVVITLSCSPQPQKTTTIAPAEPRPATSPRPQVGKAPVISTAGSPPPATRSAPGSEIVTIRAGLIEVRPLLPRAHTAFHVRNETGIAHQIELRGTRAQAHLALPPGGNGVLSAAIGDGAYELVCTVPGHDERAGFRTYVPGAPLTIPHPREGRPR